jgi:sporulation protein YqfC
MKEKKRKISRQSRQNNRKKRFGNLFTEVFEMPEELSMDMPRITLIGNIKLSVENHKGIMEYSEHEIRLKVNDGFLVAKGEKLVLKNISSDEVLLQGEITQMSIVLDQNSYEGIDDLEV